MIDMINSRSGARLAGIALLTAAMAAGGTSSAQKTDPKISFERYQLDNGLEVILHQDNSVPLVAVNVWFHVGSGDETYGKSGFAHLFEHMLFQGSKNVGADQHFAVLKKIGASGINGSTTTDRTNYFEVVPSNQLGAALWLESDRMGYMLPMLTQESFANQQEVVRNERRQRTDNVAYGKSRMLLAEMLWPKGHPYRYSVIGRHEDLANASVADVVRFYKTWYVPANATIVLAGDFDIADAKKQIQHWFGDFPKSVKPTHREIPAPVLPHTRKTVKDPFAKLRLLQYNWHTPKFYAPGDAELDVVGSVLTSRTGRLYKRLVLQEQLAVQVFGGQRSRQLSSVFNLGVMLRTGADIKRVEQILDEEINRISTEPISKREFDRFVISTESGFVWRLERLMARAQLLQGYNHFVGRPDYITQDLDRYRKTSPAKVMQVAKKYLQKAHRIELLTVPTSEGAKGK